MSPPKATLLRWFLCTYGDYARHNSPNSLRAIINHWLRVDATIAVHRPASRIFFWLVVSVTLYIAQGKSCTGTWIRGSLLFLFWYINLILSLCAYAGPSLHIKITVSDSFNDNTAFHWLRLEPIHLRRSSQLVWGAFYALVRKMNFSLLDFFLML